MVVYNNSTNIRDGCNQHKHDNPFEIIERVKNIAPDKHHYITKSCGYNIARQQNYNQKRYEGEICKDHSLPHYALSAIKNQPYRCFTLIRL